MIVPMECASWLVYFVLPVHTVAPVAAADLPCSVTCAIGCNLLHNTIQVSEATTSVQSNTHYFQLGELLYPNLEHKRVHHK